MDNEIRLVKEDITALHSDKVLQICMDNCRRMNLEPNSVLQEFVSEVYKCINGKCLFPKFTNTGCELEKNIYNYNIYSNNKVLLSIKLLEYCGQSTS